VPSSSLVTRKGIFRRGGPHAPKKGGRAQPRGENEARWKGRIGVKGFLGCIGFFFISASPGKQRLNDDISMILEGEFAGDHLSLPQTEARTIKGGGVSMGVKSKMQIQLRVVSILIRRLHCLEREELRVCQNCIHASILNLDKKNWTRPPIKGVVVKWMEGVDLGEISDINL